MVPRSGGGGHVSDVLCAAGGGWSSGTCLQDRASGREIQRLLRWGYLCVQSLLSPCSMPVSSLKSTTESFLTALLAFLLPKLHLCRDLYTSTACLGAQPSTPWLLTALGQLSVTLCPSLWPGDAPPCLRFIHIPSCFSGRVKSLPVWKPCTFCSLCCLLSCSVVSDSVTPWTAATQAPLSFTISLLLLLLSRFSRVRLCATPQTAAHQAPPSLGFSRQEHWSGLPFPSPMHESEK